jgi:TAT (twin-arginine translocation) pathway signal sequence
MAADDVQQTSDESRGLSRRQLIKASAVAGAAAWTAPVIIDSLSSPAAAGSTCYKYYVKLVVRYNGNDTPYGRIGQCYCQDPACTNGCPTSSCSASGYIHMCGPSSDTDFCNTAGSPSITFAGTSSSSTYTITLNDANCHFSKDRSKTNFDGVGNYAWANNGGTQNCKAASISSDGKTATYTDTSPKTLDFVYAEFCCGFNTTTTTTASNPVHG